jgi:TonB-dependent SusC/RagA subfamily outer membrane receptor
MNKSILFRGKPLPKLKLYAFCFFLFLCNTGFAQGSYSFTWVQKPISEIFTAIEKEAKVTFAYNPSDINASTPVTLSVINYTLDQLVTAVCNKVNAVYKKSGKIIMIQSQNKADKEFTITGKIVDSNNEDIAGATISVRSSGKNAVSRDNGTFSIKVKEGEEAAISKVGFKTKTFTASGSDKIPVFELSTEVLDLNPVVVTALGIKRETRSLGYAVGTVDGDELNKAKETNVINSLAGKVAGLIINSTAGGPAGSSRVIIRGNTEITGNNQPLYVVDGIPIDNSNYGQVGSEKYSSGYDFGDAISAINPDDIETISVLKGPSASALYGSRAGHGVIRMNMAKEVVEPSPGMQHRPGLPCSAILEQSLTLT